MSFFDDASLVMIPSGYKDQKVYSVKPTDGTGDLTFTRASDATRVASDGLIEKVRTNLVLNSATFVTQTITVGANPHTISFTGTGTIVITGTGSGTLVGTGAANRVSLSFTTTAGSLILTGTGTVTLAQLETGDIATDYIATTTTAVSVGPVSGLPRLDYLDSTCPRLLLEPQRTNVDLNSETFGASTGTTIVLNNTTSPDGYVNADKLVEDTSTGVHITSTGGNLGGSVDSSVYSVSIFAKASGRTRINIFDNNQAGGGYSNFDIANGIVISGTGKIEDYGNGWYRCIIFPTKNNSTTSNVQIRLIDSGTNTSYTGNGTGGVYIWGAQVEAGAYATSYIPTLGASVTRVADAASTASVPSLIGQTEGTMFIEFNRTNVLEGAFFMLSNLVGTTTNAYQNSFYFLQQANGTMVVEVYVAAVPQVLFTVSALSVGTHKMALAYKANDFALYVDGVQLGTDTSGSVPTANFLSIGGAVDGGAQKQAVSQALLFPTRLTNAQLAELTA